MTQRVLVDTGSLVAILSQNDHYHQACIEQLGALSPPLLTCWPVLTEVAWLLRHQPDAIQKMFKSIGGLLHILELDDAEAESVGKIMHQYRDLNAQLADACLIYLAEREGIDTVFTLDRRDFLVYRLKGNRSLQLLPAIDQ